MTLKEAKKILNKEGFHMALAKEVVNQTGAMREFEKPEVCEAIKVVNANRWTVALSPTEWDERKARLKKEYEENTKAPGSAENSIKGDLSGNKSIEHCGEPIPGSPLSAVEGIKLKWKDNRNTSENPALEESASQFNDALLDEQAKKIVELTEENERLKDQVAVIYACKENNEKYNLKQIKRLGKEIAKLNCIIHDKNAILSDVAEELRLTKIREKNLAELGLKYVGENEKLKKKLADKIVDEIDARVLKSAESALAYKEKVIAEKDEVIADLTHELKAKHKKYVWYKGAYEAAQQILNTIADYAAKHPDKKFSDQMVQDSHVECRTKVLVDKSVFEQIMKKAYGK